MPEAPRFFEAMVRGPQLGGHPDHRQPHLRHLLGHPLARGHQGDRGRAWASRSPSRRTSSASCCTTASRSRATSCTSGYLVAPDLLGPEVRGAAGRDATRTRSRPSSALHRLGNQMMEVLGGRMTHPVTVKPGGFAKLPTEADLRELKATLEAARPRPEDHRRRWCRAWRASCRRSSGRPSTSRWCSPDVYTFYHGAHREHGHASTTAASQQFESVVNEYVVAAVHGQVVQVAPRLLRRRRAGPVQPQRRPALPAGGEDGARRFGPEEGLLQSVHEQRGAGGRVRAGGRARAAAHRRTADRRHQARDARRSSPASRRGRGRASRRRAASCSTGTRSTRTGNCTRRQHLHPDQPEPREHPEGFRGPGAADHRPAAGRDPAAAGDAGARLRSVHLVLDALI